jgi:hypothetical protein
MSPPIQDAPRRLSNIICPPKLSLLNRKRLLQILATSFTQETRAKMRKREEWERWEKFEHNNSRERIDVK